MPSPAALRTFEAAARLGSFKAAAAELSVTPTAVSHQMRSLEDLLGFPLFIRRIRAIELTPNGRRLAESTRAAFQQITHALEEIAATEAVLNVSTTPAFAALWLVPRLGHFQDLHPEHRIQVSTSTRPTDLARDRHIDIAIRYGIGPYPGLHAAPLDGEAFGEETFGVYGTADYLEKISQLQNARFIEISWRQLGLDDISWDTWLAAAGISLHGKMRVQHVDHEHHAIQAGLASQGLILASSILVADFVRRGWLQPYLPDVRIAGRKYTALCLPEHSGVRKVMRFLHWLRQEAPKKTG